MDANSAVLSSSQFHDRVETLMQNIQKLRQRMDEFGNHISSNVHAVPDNEQATQLNSAQAMAAAIDIPSLQPTETTQQVTQPTEMPQQVTQPTVSMEQPQEPVQQSQTTDSNAAEIVGGINLDELLAGLSFNSDIPQM